MVLSSSMIDQDLPKCLDTLTTTPVALEMMKVEYPSPTLDPISNSNQATGGAQFGPWKHGQAIQNSKPSFVEQETPIKLKVD